MSPNIDIKAKLSIQKYKEKPLSFEQVLGPRRPNTTQHPRRRLKRTVLHRSGGSVPVSSRDGLAEPEPPS
ncbi:hypothetical protein TIFTF001_028131 [Ficus carica]|uniref:Uncharacterized protein n=1 Tax=Ficus carica TaxID=3494 RepID=A0AA88DPF9_FICCA|nr:hypothetical protein TIFTF001_028131 [Ficus carica]